MQASEEPLTTSAAEVAAWDCLQAVLDPEIPVLSVVELGIVRSVVATDGCVEVGVAPTYSGCPATEVIERSIVDALRKNGFTSVTLRRILSPPWTTDWITESGREKLLNYGIAPPIVGAGKRALLGDMRHIACPRCASVNTALVSEFGSTACKAAYKCNDCLEPFEYFKCI